MEPLGSMPSQLQSTRPASPRLSLGPRWLLELQPSLGLQERGCTLASAVSCEEPPRECLQQHTLLVSTWPNLIPWEYQLPRKQERWSLSQGSAPSYHQLCVLERKSGHCLAGASPVGATTLLSGVGWDRAPAAVLCKLCPPSDSPCIPEDDLLLFCPPAGRPLCPALPFPMETAHPPESRRWPGTVPLS